MSISILFLKWSLFLETSVRNCRCSPRNNPEERGSSRYLAAEAWNHASFMSFLHPKMLLCFTRVPRIFDSVARFPQIARVWRPLVWKAVLAVLCWLALLSVVIQLPVSVHIPSPGIGGGGMGGAGGCGGLDCTVLSCLGRSCCLLLIFCFCSSCCLLLHFCFCSSCCLLLHFCFCSWFLGLVVLLISIGISFTCVWDFDDFVSVAACCVLELFGLELVVAVLDAS